tara:strand:+ start:11872 stop:13977 length:2106 start_codon:yes stop_codon:yes gene_type:complete
MKITILISGGGTNLQEIIDRINDGVLGPDAQINQVISNRKKAYGLERANNFSIPAIYLPWIKKNSDDKLAESRQQYELRLLKQITNSPYGQPQLIVLAGWMHILGEQILTNLNQINIPVINLHPALPGAFPGVDAIGQAYTAWTEGKLNPPITGCMVHKVIPEIDAGEVLATAEVPILPDDTLESLTARIRYIEKPTLINGIMKIFSEIEDSRDITRKLSLRNIELQQKYKITSGKVRDIWRIGHGLLALVSSNRFSSFDRHICNIPKKGYHLTEISRWWFKKTTPIIRNHMVFSNKNIMIVKECDVIPIEVVVRAYITGSTSTSLWTNYNICPVNERVYCGIKFPEGLKKNQKLDKLVITPTTKDKEHDVPISKSQIIKNSRKFANITLEEWEYIERKALELFHFASVTVARMGLILVDTKMEFGRDCKGRIVLIDEVFTPDSSRYWVASSYKERFLIGQSPERLDKDLIREWVASRCDPYDTNIDIPEIPLKLVKTVYDCYKNFYKDLIGENSMLTVSDFYTNSNSDSESDSGVDVDNFMPSSESGLITNIEDELDNYFFKFHSPICVILTDCFDQDSKPIIKIIQDKLHQLNIYSIIRECSPYRDTSKLLCILEDYCQEVDDGRKMVFCCVSKNPSSLSGIVSGNTSVPVITCPIMNDYCYINQVSDDPISFVTNPTYCAVHIKKILSLGKNKRQFLN